jgi:hypothetical protein
VIKIIFINPKLNIQPIEKVDFQVDGQAQYVSSYDKIVQSIHLEQELVVLVTEKSVFRWLSALKDKYKEVVIEERNLRQQLQAQIGIAVPEYVSDQKIIESKLLELKIPSDLNSSFDDYLLRIFIGDFILTPASFHNIVSFVSQYDSQRWQDVMRRPLVKEIFQSRLKILRENFQKTNRKAELQLLDWLTESPEILSQNLYALRALADYPTALGKRVLGTYFKELSGLNLDLTKLSEGRHKKLIDEISVYLDKTTKNIDTLSISELVGQVSGFLEIEFEYIHRVLISGKIEIDEDLIRKIQRKFKQLKISPKYAQALDDLGLLISKPKPSTPQQDWKEKDWIDWAVREYLPYRFWLEDIGRLDNEIADIAGMYADWLYENYSNLLYHSERMAWKALLNLKDQIKEHDGVVLVVLVDNLNSKFYPDLRNQLQHSGYYEHQVTFCISNLPSCTEVSKKSILTGHYSPFTGTSYSQPLVNAWQGKLNKKVRYLSGIGALRSVSKRDADVYFLNYLPLDITLHQSEFNTGISHAQAIRSYVTALAQDIKSFAKELHAEQNLLLIITSDHGSTKIPKDGINVIKGDFYKKKAIDAHHRYIEISDEEVLKLREVPNYECYLFDRDLFELPSNYLVARRLYHFSSVDENVYVHGGLTPEETLIPLAIYKPVTMVASPLDVQLVSSKKLYLGTKVDLKFEVTNLNNYSSENITFDITDQNFEADLGSLDSLKQLERTQISIPARCLRTADRSATALAMKVSFAFLGKTFEYIISIPIELIDPAQTKFDMDNL